MRQQHHHYREHTPLGIREIAWDNDIFLLQVAFCVLDPDLVFATILDRFSLVYWFAGNIEHAVYAHPVAGMVEELLSLLIVCLSEPSNVAAWPQTRFTRREVVHVLVLGPSTYSDLVRRLPERAAECLELASIIQYVATFKPSETASDFGTYELKEDCFAEVDPLFYHFSRNQKQEVEAILEKRWTKAGNTADDYLHLPQPIEIPASSPYSALPNAFQSSILPQIVFFTLWNLVPLHRLSNKEGPTMDGKARESQESVIELGLHLVMLSLQHQPAIFSHPAATTAYVPEWTLVRLLCQLEDEDLFKNVKGRVRWCLDAIQAHFPDQVEQWRVVVPPPEPITSSTTPGKKGPKKSKAAARQAAIMQQFSKDQKAFLDAHGDEDDKMEDEVDSEEIVYGACMVCQEDCNSNVACGSMALVQPSKILRLAPLNSAPWLAEACTIPSSLDRANLSASASASSPSSPSPLPDAPPLPDAFPCNNFKFGLYTSTCGHLMHLSCFESYTKTTETRHHAQAARNHPENVARREFVCPLCKSLGNVLLPMQSPYDRPGKPIKSDSLPLRDWLRLINTEALRDVPDTSLMFQHRTETGELPCLFADASLPASSTTVFPPLSALDLQTRKMTLDLYSIVRPISQQSAHLRSRSPPEALMQERPATGMYLPDDLVAYTIAGLEVTLRGQPVEDGKTIADAVNPATTQLIKCLLGAMRSATYCALEGEKGLVRARYGLFARLLPEWYRDTKTSSPLLLRDPLGILVEGAAVAYEYLQPILILTYYAELCRAVLGLLHLLRSFPGRPFASLVIDQLDGSEAKEIFGNVRHLIGGMCSHSRILQFEVTEFLLCLPDDLLARLLYAYTLPFLRRAAILHQVVKSNQPAQSSLLTDSTDGSAPPPTASEYSRLLHRLHIPSPACSLSPSHGATLPAPMSAISDTTSSYLKQFSAFYGPRSPSSLVRLGYPSIYELAALPVTLEGVFERYGRWVCPNCQTVPTSTAICLFCGEGVCSGVSCCKEDLSGASEGLGECNLHMRR
jgi:E3 ubiquitin-protein ligase UBR1